ncbi:MAG: hypothetical protein ACRC33_25470, partial [Gemmataceae bacterium]
LATDVGIPLGRVVVCETPALTLEKRGAGLSVEQALDPEERDEIIKVFVGDDPEPTSVVNVRHSIVHLCADHFFQAFRLYLVPDDGTDDAQIARLREAVKDW